MNTFQALNIFYREDVISDFLKTCFEDSSQFLSRFLQNAEISYDEAQTVKIYNRKALGKSIGIPDMLIVIEGETNKVVVIENKLGAAEGDTQTERYFTTEARRKISDIFTLQMDRTEFSFVYLTLDTTTSPNEAQYKHVFYSQFLNGQWLLQDASLQLLFSDFKQMLEQFYLPLQSPIQTLSTNVALDQMQKKIVWQTLLFEKFNEYRQFIFDWGNVGGSGRNNFLFLISKSNWRSSQSFDVTGLANTFYVHVDTYINLLGEQSTVREVGVRFETNPYRPKKYIEQVEGYKEFVEMKRKFGELLFEKVKAANIQAKKTNYDLLVLSIPIHEVDVEASVNQYVQTVLILETLIDEVLQSL